MDNPNLMQSIQTDVRKNYHEQLDIKVSNIVPFQKDSTADGQGHSAKEK